MRQYGCCFTAGEMAHRITGKSLDAAPFLKYLEETPAEESMWEGECFVFDGRTAVTHGVEEGENSKCHACGWPLLPAEVELTSYEHGVSCVYCIEKTTEKQKAGFRMRQSQIAAAKRKRL